MNEPGLPLLYFAPSAALSRYVTVIFAWTGTSHPYAEWMPAIDAQIAVRIAGDGCFEFSDGRIVAPPSAAVIGSLSGSTRLRVGAGFQAIGAGLTAAGWRALIGIGADEMTDRVAGLAEFWGDRRSAELLQLLLMAPSLTHRVPVFEKLLLAMCDARRVSWREHAVDHWIAASSLSTDALVSMLGLSHRQAARVVLAGNGLSPKLLAIKHRALRAATRVVSDADAGPWDHGYADQSHMTRDFKRFIGATPGRVTEHELRRHVLGAPERAGAHLAQISDRLLSSSSSVI